MKKIFYRNSFDSSLTSLPLMIIRIVMGAAFIFHGYGKIMNPMGWMPPGGNFQIHPFFQMLSAIAEFAGGIALILGLLTQITSFGLIINMLTALYFHIIVRGDPFVNTKGGGSYELALTYLSLNILFFIIGPGKYSVDYLIFGKTNK